MALLGVVLLFGHVLSILISYTHNYPKESKDPVQYLLPVIHNVVFFARDEAVLLINN